MREVKYRGYCESLNKWVYGYLTFGGKNKFYIENKEGKYLVIESSIGQFTGLRDKNNTEIYENDFLKYPYSEYSVDIIEVVYKEEEACFIGRYPSHIGDYEMLNGDDFEVIGNSYETKII